MHTVAPALARTRMRCAASPPPIPIKSSFVQLDGPDHLAPGRQPLPPGPRTPQNGSEKGQRTAWREAVEWLFGY